MLSLNGFTLSAKVKKTNKYGLPTITCKKTDIQVVDNSTEIILGCYTIKQFENLPLSARRNLELNQAEKAGRVKIIAQKQILLITDFDNPIEFKIFWYDKDSKTILKAITVKAILPIKKDQGYSWGRTLYRDIAEYTVPVLTVIIIIILLPVGV